MELAKYPAAILLWLITASFISEISLSMPYMNSRMKLISSSFLYFCKWSSVIKNEKSYFTGYALFFLKILNLSALKAKNLWSMCDSRASTISFFLIEMETLQELTEPSMRHDSCSFLVITS